MVVIDWTQSGLLGKLTVLPVSRTLFGSKGQLYIATSRYGGDVSKVFYETKNRRWKVL